MKPPEAALRQLVRQWLDKAAADFEAAEQLSAQGGRFREIVAFHCQQAVEKYLQALLPHPTSVPRDIEIQSAA
jgi:HEPN domain-containing protein